MKISKLGKVMGELVVKEETEESKQASDEEDIYEESSRENQLEDDELSPEQFWFMEGFESAEEK